MPSSFRNPKTLAEWIELDYVRRPRRLWRLRNIITGLTLLLFLVLLALAYWSGNRMIYQAGPVSSAHALFNENCGVCHVEPFRTAERFFAHKQTTHSVADETCKTCHNGAPHHAPLVSDANCVTCHQEHRGQPVLARVVDRHCTVCHADLTGKAASHLVAHISQFATDHPPFGTWRPAGLTDPGTLRFNHKVHLEMKKESVQGIDKTFADLKDQKCNYCHQPDPAGRYMQPINYEQHCRPCHPLGVQVVGDWQDTSLRAAADQFRAEQAPHKAPMIVRAVLRERYAQFVKDNTAVLGTSDAPVSTRWLPGKQGPSTAADKEYAWVAQQLHEGERTLFEGAGGCRYCHPVVEQRDTRRLPVYEPTKIRGTGLPERWFPHSVFSHERHRMLLCTECHAAARSDRTSDVLMPSIEDCRKCHAPGKGPRTDCSECHLYHDRTQPLFQGTRTIAESSGSP
jgi:hypothetical protein